MTRKALRDFRTFCAGYPNVGVLEWLDDEIDYFDALYEVSQLRKAIDEEFFMSEDFLNE